MTIATYMCVKIFIALVLIIIALIVYIASNVKCEPTDFTDEEIREMNDDTLKKIVQICTRNENKQKG